LKKNIKIAHIITRLIEGGAQESVLLTTKYLARSGFNVYLVSGPTMGPEGHISIEGIKGKVKLYIIPELIREISFFKDITAFVKLFLFIKRNNFDIVHTHTSKAGILGRLAAWFARVPVIIHTPHGHFFYGHFDFFKTKFFIFFEKVMALLTDKIITLTAIGREEHVNFAIGKKDRFMVISDGIELDRFTNCRTNNPALRSELGIPPGAPVIGIVARLVAVKGHKYLLTAFKKVLREAPDARLLVVGDGVLKEKLKSHCRKIGITKNVIFTGLRYDIPRILSVLDAVALTSLNEGLGIALLEAMVMKKPVVASNLGGIPEIVEDGVIGYLVPPRDPFSLADRILKIIRDPETAKIMGENGYKKIISSFSIEDKIEALESLYKDLLEKKLVMKTDKIKVLHVITRLIVGGAQENTLYTVSGIDKNRYWVMLVSGRTEGPEGNIEESVDTKNIRFIKIPELVREISLFKDLVAFFKLYRLIKRFRFDIVHTHTSKAGILGRCAARLAGCPVIIHTPHGHLFYGYYGKVKTKCFIWLERAISRLTSCLVTLTEIGKNEHVSFGVGEARKFKVVQSGINIERFLKDGRNTPDSLKEQFGLLSGKRIVGTVARLVPIKGHSYFIDAAEKVIKEIPDTRFMIIGDGSLRGKLERRVRKKNIQNYFYFLGLRNDVPELLRLFDVFVLSSLNEGMGRVVVEAMASAKPVVATRVGGIPEVIIDNETGLLVKPKDTDGLAKNIITLLKDERMAKSMGEAGRKRARDIFSKDEMIRKVDSIYRELLAKEGRKCETF